MSIIPRQQGKSDFVRRLTELYLDGGKTILECNGVGCVRKKRIKHLTLIEPIRDPGIGYIPISFNEFYED